MKILFIGESWLGSCARSLREALARRSDVELDDLSEDAWFTKPRTLWLRAVNRLTAAAYRKEFNAQVLARVRALQPDVVMTYKGTPVHAGLVGAIHRAGVMTVNVYPDYSPHAYGAEHRRAVGTYDLVISTKQYHPKLWRALYGYENRCVFVPQGYDPALHLVGDPPADQSIDVAMVATYRPEYGELIFALAGALGDQHISVSIGGHGWEAVRTKLPDSWRFLGGLHGRQYVFALRQAKICIAPLTRNVVINGQRQPGDVDTTRTYELAAAHCFFIHRRTDYVKMLYDEATEVPMFDDAAELAAHIRRFVSDTNSRDEMAAAAHHRAVPAYSMDERAADILNAVQKYA